MENQIPNTASDVDRAVDNFLSDPAKKAAILQRLARLDVPHLAHSGPNGGGGGALSSSGLTTNPSGMVSFPSPQGAIFNPAAWYPLPPFPVMPPQSFAWPLPAAPQAPQTLPTNTNTTAATLAENNPTGNVRENTDVEQHEDGDESDQSGESDVVHLLGEQEADQFREPEFDPKVKDQALWQPTEAMLK